MKTQPSRPTWATVLLYVLALAACGGGGGDAAGKGQLALVLASGTAPAAAHGLSEGDESGRHGGQGCASLQAASVTFSAILARTLDGTLIDVTIALPVTVDVLALANGKVATLPVGFLPAGTYDQFVVVMKTVELTLADGTKVAITPPGGGWTAIVSVTQPFTVMEGQTTTVTLKFRRDLSFACGRGGWEFHPKFESDGKD